MVKRTEKTCRKKQHVKIDNMKEMSDLICGKAAVGGNYNSTRDILFIRRNYHDYDKVWIHSSPVYHRYTGSNCQQVIALKNLIGIFHQPRILCGADVRKKVKY